MKRNGASINTIIQHSTSTHNMQKKMNNKSISKTKKEIKNIYIFSKAYTKAKQTICIKQEAIRLSPAGGLVHLEMQGESSVF